MPAKDTKHKSTLKVEPNKPPSPGVVVGTTVKPTKPPSPVDSVVQVKPKKPTEEKVVESSSAATVEGPKKPIRKVPEKSLYSWNAPARPFKRRGRDFWVTAIAISVVVGLILFAVEGFMPVILLIALVFLFYVMNSVKPEDIEYKVTNYGISMAGKVTEWDRVTRFWFSNRFDNKLLIFEALSLAGRLELVVNDADIEKLRDVLSKYLTEEEAPPSYLDKTANWFSKKLPGNK